MTNLLAIPTFDSLEQTQRCRILHFVICGTVLVTVSFITLVMIHQPATISRGVCTITFIVTLGIVLLRVNQHGRTQLAAALFAAGLLALMTGMAVTAGGVHSPGVTMYFIVVLMVGLLLGERAGTITAIGCAALGLGLLLAEYAGLLPPGIHYNSATIWLLSCLYMTLVIALLRVPAMLIKVALFHADSELQVRKRAEMQLRDSKQLMQSMIENTPAAVAMFDKEMRYLAYSKRWLTDYRLGNKDLHGLTHYQVFPEIGEEWKAIHRKCVAGARDAREADPFPRGDGTVDIIRWVVEPWFKGDDEIGGITMFTEVITDRVRAEEERKLLREQLLEAQKIEALGALAGGVAHDFNNILAMICTNAELGLAEMKEEGPTRASFLEIVRATARARDVVKQILLFGRRQETALETILLIHVVEDALTFLHAALPANVEIRKVLTPEIPPIRGNASQIYQILLNLGVNAGQAMPDGGTLWVGLDSIDVAAAEADARGDLREGTYVRITMQDTGIGVRPEILHRIFEPFFTTKGPGGTGLGLSVVHGIVKDHRGAIRVQSQPGRGTTFQVLFPSAPAGQVNGWTPAASRKRGCGQHIMYVDDEVSLGLPMKRILELQGYRCTFCSNPEIALENFRSFPSQFDAVIADLIMPHLSGIELIKHLRAVRPDIPVALTSGRFDIGAGSTFNCEHINVRISKPATIEELNGALAALLPDNDPTG